MLFFQLLVFCVFSVYAAQDAKLECGTLLLARPYSPGPSTASKPYIPISFNLEKDIKVAHLRPVLEILKKDVELVLIEPTTKTWVVFPLMIKEVFRDDVQESALHEDFRDTLYSMGHPMVVYSRRPGRNSVITRTHYKLCDTDTDHCIPFYIRVANSKTAYVVGYESELLNEHTEISQCDFPSHVELFKKVYNIQMNTPNTVPQTMTTSVFHVEASKLTTAAALVIYLWQDEDPEFFWDLVKDYFKNADKHETIARISMKKYKETGSYCLVVLLSKIPTEEILRSIRAMVRPYVGPCSAYFASNDLTAGVAMYTGIKLCYSDTTLTVTGSNRRAKFNSTIASEAHFHEAISKQNDGAIFRISRSFLNKNIIDEFNARVTAPMHGRRAVFEKIVRILFYSNNSWSDNIASIDLRSEDGQLKLTVMFRLLKEKDRQEVQEYVIDTVAKIYEELTGTNIVTGFSEVVNLPPRKHVLVTAEPKKEPVVETVAPTPKPKVSASGKKKSKKNRSLKTKTTNSAAKENVKDTSETVVEVSESVKKPVKRPEDMTKFESWLFDLTDDEFDMELEAFSKRLHPLNYTPETNYWKVMAFQDGEAMMEVINQFDSFSNSPENFARVIQEIFVNEQWKQSVDTLLLLFVNRNYMKAGPVIATASAMTCKFAWSSNNLIIMKKLMNRYLEILMTWPEFYRITRFAFDVKMELEHVAILTTIEIPDEYAAQIDEISARIRESITLIGH